MRILTEENQEWCDWKFQIHWHKLEWVNPMSCDEINKYILCVYKNGYFRENNKPVHSVGHLKLGSLDIYELFKITQKIDEKEASVTGKI